MSELLRILIDEIIRNIDKSTPAIIAICGAADLGKSYISRQLCELLVEKSIKANHLAMDSFLINRKIRQDLGISGYNIESYDLKGLNLSLEQFINREKLQFKLYNHSTGKTEGNDVFMNPSDILILDGLHSMSEMLNQEIQYSIFLYADENKLIKIRREADLNKRNYTEQYSMKISQIELQRYKNNVERYKNNADVKLFLENRWNYQMEY